MTDMFDRGLDMKALNDAVQSLPKTLIPTTGRDTVITLGADKDQVLVTRSLLLASAFLQAGSPTVKDWNALGAAAIGSKVEAIKPELHKAVLGRDPDPTEYPMTELPEAETGSTAPESTPDAAPETGAPAPEVTGETETVSTSDASKPEQDADKAASETVPAATGVRQIYLLKQSKLGPVGKVVRLTHRKIADLGLTEGEDFRTPTALELAIGGE